MDDLISRKAAVSRMSDLLVLELKMRRVPTWNEVYNAMEDLPSAEPERRGRWDFIGDQMLQCSECGHVFTQEFLEGWRESVHEPLFPPHCPSCGSYNGGEQE